MHWIKRHQTKLSWLVSGFALIIYLSYKYPHNNRPRARPPATASNPFPTNGGPVRAMSFYAPPTGRTSVYLSGDLELLPPPPWTGGRLLLSPIIEVEGNQISVPEGVLLRLISVAGARRLAGAVIFEVMVDGASAWRETKLYPAAPSVQGDGLTESVGWLIPYDAFVRMARGADVRVRLGGEEIALGREHLAALRAMVRCVEARRCG